MYLPYLALYRELMSPNAQRIISLVLLRSPAAGLMIILVRFPAPTRRLPSKHKGALRSQGYCLVESESHQPCKVAKEEFWWSSHAMTMFGLAKTEVDPDEANI